MKDWQYAFLVFFGGCCYGVLSTFVKLAYAAGFNLQEVTGGQCLFGTLLIWSFFAFTKKQRLSLKQAGILLLSGIPFGLTSLVYYQSLKTLSASLAVIFLFQFVWMGTAFDYFFNKKRPTQRKMAAIFFLLIGSALAANVLSAEGGRISVEGMAWGLLAALSYTTAMFLSSSVGKEVTPVLRSAMFSTGAMLVVFLVFPPMFLMEPAVVMTLFPYGLVLGLFGIALPPLLFTIGMPHVGPGLGTILSASELPVAILMSLFVLGEFVAPMQWLGVVLILLGIAGGNSRQKKVSEEMETAYES